jgi:vacuolar-type H+-ATPase subunit E/Vma4
LVASANSKIEDLKGLTDKISQKALAEAEEALAEAKQVLSDIQARIPLIDQVKEKATNAVQSAQT